MRSVDDMLNYKGRYYTKEILKDLSEFLVKSVFNKRNSIQNEV